MYGIFSKNSLIKASFFASFSRRYFSHGSDLMVLINPDISYVGAKVLVPISFARYNVSEKESSKYDRDLNLIFSTLSKKFEEGEISNVDVLLTGGLQKINWSKDKCDEIEKHFLQRHKKALEKLSHYFYWDQFIEAVPGKEKYGKLLLDVTDKSAKGTVWHDLMCSTYESTKLSTTLTDSLEYQRKEYALIASCAGLYTHVPYFGKLSEAWSYLTVAFPHLKVPCFSKIELVKSFHVTDSADANQTVTLLSFMLEQTIASPNFPKKEKMKLFKLMDNLKRAYLPEEVAKKEDLEIMSSSLKLK